MATRSTKSPDKRVACPNCGEQYYLAITFNAVISYKLLAATEESGPETGEQLETEIEDEDGCMSDVHCAGCNKQWTYTKFVELVRTRAEEAAD